MASGAAWARMAWVRMVLSAQAGTGRGDVAGLKSPFSLASAARDG